MMPQGESRSSSGVEHPGVATTRGRSSPALKGGAFWLGLGKGSIKRQGMVWTQLVGGAYSARGKRGGEIRLGRVWGAAMTLILIVLTLYIVARLLTRRNRLTGR